VSAVLAFQKLYAWNFPMALARLYHHHSPANPVGGEITRLPQAVVVDGRLDLRDGISIGELFNLKADWLTTE
jgi:hypothetical protein